jgi:glycerol uptake facilitator-like aquaporin
MSILRLSRSSTDDARDLEVSAAFFFFYVMIGMSTLRLFGSFTDDARSLAVSAAFFLRNCTYANSEIIWLFH